MTKGSAIKYMVTHGLSSDEAHRVFNYYLKNKIVKYNAHDGYTLTHGRYFDRDVLVKAALVSETEA
jgi:hypothetical protein